MKWLVQKKQQHLKQLDNEKSSFEDTKEYRTADLLREEKKKKRQQRLATQQVNSQKTALIQWGFFSLFLDRFVTWTRTSFETWKKKVKKVKEYKKFEKREKNV